MVFFIFDFFDFLKYYCIERNIVDSIFINYLIIEIIFDFYVKLGFYGMIFGN